jgi:hypothetical protein
MAGEEQFPLTQTCLADAQAIESYCDELRAALIQSLQNGAVIRANATGTGRRTPDGTDTVVVSSTVTIEATLNR